MLIQLILEPYMLVFKNKGFKMSKLINLHTKRDPIKDWEEKNLTNKKKDSNFFHKEEVYNKPEEKIYDSPEDIERIAELLAMKEEIRKCLRATAFDQKKIENEIVQKRKQELLNIKKHLQMHI